MTDRSAHRCLFMHAAKLPGGGGGDQRLSPCN